MCRRRRDKYPLAENLLYGMFDSCGHSENRSRYTLIYGVLFADQAHRKRLTVFYASIFDVLCRKDTFLAIYVRHGTYL